MLDLITRTEARALGLTRYFTGKPCPWGHITERTSGESTPAFEQREREAAA